LEASDGMKRGKGGKKEKDEIRVVGWEERGRRIDCGGPAGQIIKRKR